MDQLILTRVRSASIAASALAWRRAASTQTVGSGRVILTGATSDERVIVEAVRLVHGVKGVT